MTSTGTSAGPQARGHARLRLGTCPDSWGVWFADDPFQTPWQRFLNEVAEVGYEWLELGPFGYLPTESARLTEELDRRGLKVAGGTVHGFSGLHRPGDWPEIARITRQVAELTAAVGGRHVIFVPVPGYRDDKTGAFLEPAELDAGQWRTMTKATDELGKIVSQEHGLRLEFHPHADSHVETQSQTERFLEQTDPRYVSLCLDTGHLAYRHADNVALIGRYPDRIGYVHIKQMDPAIVARADREGLAFGQAVAMGASCEPPGGEPAIADVAKALRELDRDLFVRYWKQAIQIAVDLGVTVMNSEFNGRPEAPSASEAQFWRSLEELLPVFEREGIRLVLEPHPDDFIEDGRAGVDLVRGIDKDWVSFLYCAPHTFHQGGDIEGIMKYAGPLLTHVHVADSFDHRASSGLRYIVNPPGSPARVHQHLDIGQGDVDWDVFFRTLTEVGFDGIACVCVFAWEERARESSAYNLEQIRQYLAKHGGPPS